MIDTEVTVGIFLTLPMAVCDLRKSVYKSVYKVCVYKRALGPNMDGLFLILCARSFLLWNTKFLTGHDVANSIILNLWQPKTDVKDSCATFNFTF